MNRGISRSTRRLALAAMVGLPPLAGCSEDTVVTPPDCLTVTELLRDAATLDGQTVRACDWGRLGLGSTLIDWTEFEDGRPCCNYVEGGFDLASEPDVWQADAELRIRPFYVDGNDCEVQLSPFDPTDASAFLFVGVLSAERNSAGAISGVSLDEIDYDGSAELPSWGGAGTANSRPLKLGQFKCACPSSPTWILDCYDTGEPIVCEPE